VTALPQGQLAPAASVSAPLSAANARSDFNIGYCGYRFNGDIGAYTVRFRHYDPTPGMCRWLERDPAGYQDGPSLYSYLGRNPMAGTDPYGLFYSGSGITVLGPDQIRPPVGAGELVNPPGYGLRPALLPPDMPGHNEVLAWVEALSAIARTNAERGVDHGGGFAGLLELSMAFYLGAREGERDGALLILDNLTIGLVPGLNDAAGQVRTANASSWAYTAADWSAAVGTTTLPGGGAFKALGIGAKAAKGAKAAGAAAGAAGAAGAAAKTATRVHKNSLRYVGQTHVYRIIGPNGKTYKIGESAQGVNKAGASIRAEQQARRLTRETGELYTTEIRKVFANKASARAYERDLIERFRSLYGPNSLPGNLTNR
jgi:RHS repeat-associated protein